MRWALVITALLLTGCAASTSRETGKTAALTKDYESSEASALAFDTRVAPPYPLLGLAREPREMGAFAGFQDSVTEYFVVATDDNQSSEPWNDSYNRESISVKVGTRTR
jgi:hypothetical protein